MVTFIRLTGNRHIVIRALRTSFIVGIILNVINNPQLLDPHSTDEVHPERVILTFLVPYLVSTISAVQTRLHLNRELPSLKR
ncbi:MAG: hypothetical protein KA479_11420 [Saprospiraceae bacterium]|nr:hypothetical protein [Saprospiraceae bacterium]